MQRTSKAMKKATVVLLSLIPVQAEVYQKPLTVFPSFMENQLPHSEVPCPKPTHLECKGCRRS